MKNVARRNYASFLPHARLIFLGAASIFAGIEASAMSMTLASPAFTAGGNIPAAYTCDGKGERPALSWSGIPSGTKSLALIVDDPDAPDPSAPQRTWVHWVAYGIPPDAQGLPAGSAAASLPQGMHEGLNDWKKTGYGAPCPPIGQHRYVHKLYALDTTLPDLRQPTRQELEKAMQGHILGQTELIGLYQKKH